MKECTVIAALSAFTKPSNNFSNNASPPKPYSHFLVGLSGGLDSTVLLHALAQCVEPEHITAVHIHHGLSSNAEAWLTHCEVFARSLGVGFIAERVKVSRQKSGIESAAREARYRVFQRCINELCTNECSTNECSTNECSTNEYGNHSEADEPNHLPAVTEPSPALLLGHHLDDQQETVFLRLMRGAGPTGLQAIPSQRPLGNGCIVRPLLAISRAELQAYAEQHHLSWINDDSNQDTHFDRNFLRNTILPLLQERWPDAARRCAQTATLCVENESLLTDLAQQDTSRVKWLREPLGFSLCIPSLANLNKARRNNLLRYQLQQHDFSTPEHIHLQELHTQLALDGPFGIPQPQTRSNKPTQPSRCQIRWGNVQLSSFQNRLYALPFDKSRPDQPSCQDVFEWDGLQPLTLPLGSLGYAELSLVSGGEWAWQGGPIDVCFRNTFFSSTPTLRMQPYRRQHSQTFKKLLQEYRVPTWLRDWVPLLREQNLESCGAVGDLWVNHGHHSANHHRSDRGGYQVLWVFHPSHRPC